jgi:hypothetical protein
MNRRQPSDNDILSDVQILDRMIADAMNEMIEETVNYRVEWNDRVEKPDRR